MNSVDILEGKYRVMENGEIYSLVRTSKGKPKLKSQGKCNNGYISTSLMVNGKNTVRSVHRVVAEAFIPNPDNKPVVNHKDGDKTNNHVSNLEWCTRSENDLHAYKYGLRVAQPNMKGIKGSENPLSKPINQLTMDGKLVRRWGSIIDAVREEGFHQGNISSVANGVRNSTGGFRWEWVIS